MKFINIRRFYLLNSRNTIHMSDFQNWRKRTVLFVGIAVIAILLGFLLAPSFRWYIHYIWMDTLGFGSVFVTMLKSKVSLVLSGFFLFSIFTYVNLFWIRHSYLRYFSRHELPPFIFQKKVSQFIMIAAAVIVGVVGSTVIQGIGWEPALKLFNYETFGMNDPHFNMDISFYIFVYPFI